MPNPLYSSTRILWCAFLLPSIGVAATILSLEIDESNHARLTICSEPNETLQIERSQDLISWEQVSEVTVNDAPVVVTDETDAPQGFYRAISASMNSTILPAAEALLATLSDSEKEELFFDFDDDRQRSNWSNLPVSAVPRAGLQLGDLSETQQAAVWALLAVLLSEEGYAKVKGIVEGDDQLGNSSVFGSHLYFISILGIPSETEPWMVQFGGHHLAINLTIKGTDGVLTPSHLGAQPVRYTLNGEEVEPMKDEVDKALALMQSMSATQRDEATLGSAFRDLVLGIGADGRTIAPEGVQVSTFTPEQKAMLLDLAGEWARILYQEAAENRMAEIEANLDETWFAWSGPVGEGQAAYFRIQGPTVHIELAPQSLGGDPTNHFHTIYRDPANEYGENL